MKRSHRFAGAAIILGTVAAIQLGPAHASAAASLAAVSATAVATHSGTQMAIVRASCSSGYAPVGNLACRGTGTFAFAQAGRSGAANVQWAGGSFLGCSGALYTAPQPGEGQYVRLAFSNCAGYDWMEVDVVVPNDFSAAPTVYPVASWTSRGPGARVSVNVSRVAAP